MYERNFIKAILYAFGLRPKEIEALLLRLEGRSYSECAKALDMSYDEVRQSTRSALEDVLREMRFMSAVLDRELNGSEEHATKAKGLRTLIERIREEKKRGEFDFASD
jgi:hypothetical protein